MDIHSGLTFVSILSTIPQHFSWTSFTFLFFIPKILFFKTSQPFPSSLSSTPLFFFLLLSSPLAVSPPPSLSLSLFYSFMYSNTTSAWMLFWLKCSVFMTVQIDFKIKNASFSGLNYTWISLVAITTIFQDINRPSPVKCSYFPSMPH